MPVGNIQLMKHKARLRAQPVQPRLLQPHVVIGVEVIHPNHGFAARQQGCRDVITNEPGRAGDQEPAHAAPLAISRSSSNSSTAWPRAMWHSWIRAVSVSGTSRT